MLAHLNSKINRILSKSKQEQEPITPRLIEKITRDALIVNPGEPFVYINNFETAVKNLIATPFWLAYGGSRTASTFSFLVLRTIMASLTQNYLTGWEGDFSSPGQFMDIVDSSHCLEAGILKIHRYENKCPESLASARAKAVITTRDYPSIAASWVRMRGNRHSPFFAEHTSDQDIVNFVSREISFEKKKRQLPNCLFIKEKVIRQHPSLAIKAIVKHLSVDTIDASINAVADSFRVKAMRDMQAKVRKNSTGHDERSLLHINHISEEGFEDLETKRLVIRSFSHLLDDEGYLLQSFSTGN
jgi:hypothetical protein